MSNSTGRLAIKKEVTSTATLPEIGKIKIGEKRKNAAGKEYPTSLDYFRADGQFEPSFSKIFGAEPKMLDIIFISDDVSEVCKEQYECWKNGKKWGEGDGETFKIWDTAKNEYIENVEGSDPRVRTLGDWVHVLKMKFVLVKMQNVFGYWSFQTKAKAASIPQIIKTFDTIKEMAGTIKYIPFTLMVKKTTSYNPGTPKNYPVVSLVCNMQQDKLQAVSDYLQGGGAIQNIRIRENNLILKNNETETKKELPENAG